MKQPNYTNAIAVPTVKQYGPKNEKIDSMKSFPLKAGGADKSAETPANKMRGGGAATKGLRFSDNDAD